MRYGTKQYWIERRYGITYISPRLYHMSIILAVFVFAFTVTILGGSR